jgi:hypothetical protein
VHSSLTKDKIKERKYTWTVIMTCLHYMSKGHALSWAEWMLEVVVDPDYITDWGVFKNNVRTSFGDSDQVTMVQLKIKEVKQGHESVDDYVV